MATMRIQNVDCTVVYVDPGAAGANDGSTPSDALTSLPDPDTWTADTVYLIRRGTSDLTLLDGSVSHDNVYMIGMPKDGDTFYSVVPAEAKTAWDGDIADYANVASSGGATITMTGSYTGFFGINFKVTAHTNEFGFILMNNAASVGHFLIFCRITNPSYDLTSTSSASSGWGGRVSLEGDNITVDRCHIERQAQDADDPATEPLDHCLYFDGNHISISDTVLWVQSSSNDSSGSNAPSGIQCEAGVDIRVTDVTINVVYNDYVNNDTSFQHAIHINDSNEVYINNVTCRVDREINPTPANTRKNNDFVDLAVNDFNLLQIDGLTIDLSNLVEEYNADYLRIDQAPFTSADSTLETFMRNITVSPPSVQASTIGTRITINTSSTMVMEDCTFDVGIHDIILGNNNLSDMASGRIKNISVVGSLDLRNIPHADITSLSRADIPSNISTFPPLTVSRSNAHIKEMTLPVSWTTENQVEISQRSTVFIDSLNVPLFYTLPSSTFAKTAIYANNVAGVDGRWEGHNFSYHAETNAAFRSGGANAALKFTADSSRPDDPLWLGRNPYPGLKLTPSSTGDATLTIYVAHKFFTTAQELLENFMIMVDVPSTTTGGVVKRYNSTNQGMWHDDSSIWNNDDGLTAKRCEIPIKIDRLEAIEVRIAFRWYEGTGGYLYLDPLIELS